MKTLTIVAIVVFGFCSIVSGGQVLSVNGEEVETITLKVGQSWIVEVSSDDTSPYNAYVGFDYDTVLGSILGAFTHYNTRPAAGKLADESRYSSSSADDFEGYSITADGEPTAGVHFIFIYTPGQVGQTELKLYDGALTSVIDSVSITVVTAEMGTAFTYQGRLIDANNAADGEYDFIFDTYDSPSDGIRFSTTMKIEDVEVVDGYFTVELDFGSTVFYGDGVWLETSVRAGASSGSYTTLSPRQRITPAPYAIYANYAAGSDWNNLANIPGDISDGDGMLAESDVESYIANDVSAGYLPYDNGTKLADSGFHYDGSNIGLGTTANTSAKLMVSSDTDHYGIYSKTSSSVEGRTGIYGLASGDSTGMSHGVLGQSDSSTGTNFGVFGSVRTGSTGHSYGVYGIAATPSPGNNYGVYGYGKNYGAGSGWAGYFDGDVRVTGILNQNYDLKIATDDGAEVSIGTATIEMNRKLNVYTDSDTWSVYAQNSSTSETRYGLYGITSNNSTGSSYGVRGSSGSATGNNYGVYGAASTSSSGNNYGVYGYGNNSGTGSGYAGYFSGNVYVTGNMSAASITDRTPYPKDLATAYNAVMSMERLGDGQYMENNKELQLDHSALSDFIRSEDGYRDLSATVSCLNEVVKDLIVKQKGLIKTNEQIDLLKEQLNAMQKENQELKTHLARIESMLANPMSELKGDF